MSSIKDAAAAFFDARETGKGGPVPATGKNVETDSAYVMEFDVDRIRHMAEIWNGAWAMHQPGWSVWRIRASRNHQGAQTGGGLRMTVAEWSRRARSNPNNRGTAYSGDGFFASYVARAV